MTRALLVIVLLLAFAAPARGQTVYRLPEYTDPGHLMASADGSLWMVEQFGSVARLNPDGGVTEFLNRGDHIVLDIAPAPDGGAWLVDYTGVLRIDPAGHTQDVGLADRYSAEAVAADGDAFWIAENGPHARLEHVGATRRAFTVPAPDPWFNALAVGDGAAWYTASGLHERSVGRATADGLLSRWTLPRSFGEPGGIAVGPDGAAWFAARHAIGRVTAGGQLARFPLDLAPHDLVAGANGVWFTSDACLARIDGAGAVTTWPVPGALQLQGIAPAPGGGFWLADQTANVIRRFTPSVPAPCGPPSFTRARGETAATVSFERTGRFDGVDFFTDIGVSISRHGRVVYSERVPGRFGSPARSDSTSTSVRDLDGDGEPEVTLLLNSNGAHCCSWSRVLRYDARRRTYVAHTHFWGDAGAEPALRDLDGDHRPELLSLDDRFEELGSFATTARPIRIWAYRRGTFTDVTRRYPRLIRRDAAKLWRGRKSNPRGVLPAWAADEYLLGNAAAADRVLEAKLPRGFVNDVKRLLRRVVKVNRN